LAFSTTKNMQKNNKRKELKKFLERLISLFLLLGRASLLH
jgi:hypothetical protein